MKANSAGPSDLVVTRGFDGSVVEIAVRGRWRRETAVDVFRAMRKSLAEHPCAIIVDLHAMSDLDGNSAPTWIAASQAAMTLRPPAQIVLCAPPTRQVVARLRQLGGSRFLSLFVTMEQARTAVASALPLTDQLQLRWLAPDPDTLTAVRDVVALACRVWGLSTLADVAQEVALDLVTDSLRYAGTTMLFTVSRRSSSLYVALRDREAALPPLRTSSERLSVATARSYACGASATHDGKVVWAVVRPRSPREASRPA